jgi:tRNA modification GTPase
LLAVVLKAPASYTGATAVVFTCHGGDWSAPRLLAALLVAGARAAGPGEFTERAFLNGRMDLARAEAVADVIHAETDLAHRLAARQVVGALSAGLSGVAEPLRDLLAEVEARVDFAEDVASAALPRTLPRASRGRARRARCSMARTRAPREGARLALVGRPNVGNRRFNASWVRNALVAAGSARPRRGSSASPGGCPCPDRHGGLREFVPEGEHAPVEGMGIARTREELAGADVALLVPTPPP